MVPAPETKARLMTILLIAFLVALAVAAGFVLADSGLRMWSAVGALKTRRALMIADAQSVRGRRATVRVSYARPLFPTQQPRRRAAA